MEPRLSVLSDKYRRALAGYLHGAGEIGLLAAYDLGRAALADGFGVLDVVELHHRAMAELLPDAPDLAATLGQAQTVLLEALSPFEVARREFKDGNEALRHLNKTLEDEVHRIAHSVHDNAGQLLAAASITLDNHLQKYPDQSGAIGEIRALLDRLEMQLRRMSHELRPTVLDNLGLLPALEMLAQGVQARAKLEVSVHGSTDGRLAPAAEIALYRAAQEALTNVVRHAGAHHVEVVVKRTPSAVVCTVSDDGQGLAPDGHGQGGIGLLGIRERLACVGGTLRLGASPSGGVSFEAKISLAEDEHAEIAPS